MAIQRLPMPPMAQPQGGALYHRRALRVQKDPATQALAQKKEDRLQQTQVMAQQQQELAVISLYRELRDQQSKNGDKAGAALTGDLLASRLNSMTQRGKTYGEAVLGGSAAKSMSELREIAFDKRVPGPGPAPPPGASDADILKHTYAVAKHRVRRTNFALGANIAEMPQLFIENETVLMEGKDGIPLTFSVELLPAYLNSPKGTTLGDIIQGKGVLYEPAGVKVTSPDGVHQVFSAVTRANNLVKGEISYQVKEIGSAGRKTMSDQERGIGAETKVKPQRMAPATMQQGFLLIGSGDIKAIKKNPVSKMITDQWSRIVNDNPGADAAARIRMFENRVANLFPGWRIGIMGKVDMGSSSRFLGSPMMVPLGPNKDFYISLFAYTREGRLPTGAHSYRGRQPPAEFRSVKVYVDEAEGRSYYYNSKGQLLGGNQAEAIATLGAWDPYKQYKEQRLGIALKQRKQHETLIKDVELKKQYRQLDKEMGGIFGGMQ